MKKRYAQTHLQQVFADLERQGLNEVHAAMAHNIIEYRIRGPLEYETTHKTDVLQRISMHTPHLVGAVELIFKNVGK